MGCGRIGGQRFPHARLRSKWLNSAFNGKHRLIWNNDDLPTGVPVYVIPVHSRIQIDLNASYELYI